MFDKPPESKHRHLKALYVSEFVNGKPMNKILVDGGATVNTMLIATFKKLGRCKDDLIDTNVVLNDFDGNTSDAQGALNIELTIGRKTIPTMFFIIGGKG
jgi:hypothetical protein